MDINNKKKVLFVETGLGFGGSAVSLYHIVSNLQEYEPRILLYTKKHSKFVEFFKRFDPTYLDVKVNYIFEHKYKRLINIIKLKALNKILYKLYVVASFISDRLIQNKILKIIKSEGISVIYANNTLEGLIVSAAEKANIPCVVHLRGHTDAHARKSQVDYVSRLIAPTRKIQQYACTQLGVAPEKTEVIHNSIEIEKYSSGPAREEIRARYGIASDTVVIGMFARIIRMKGQMLVAKAIIKLLQANYTVKCMFIGDASDFGELYIEELKAYVEEKGFSKKFVFTGYQPNISDFYSAVDIIIHPSLEDEAFGRIIIESWAARKPLIASDIPASVELIDNEKTGLIFRNGDLDNLCEKLIRVINNTELAEELTDNGFEEVKSFDCKVLTRRVEAVLNMVTENVKKQDNQLLNQGVDTIVSQDEEIRTAAG